MHAESFFYGIIDVLSDINFCKKACNPVLNEYRAGAFVVDCDKASEFSGNGLEDRKIKMYRGIKEKDESFTSTENKADS